MLVRFAGLVRLVDRARIEERRARHEAELAGRRVELQNEQLRELDRLKDEFVSSVSHELRTPLTSITGYVELLLEGAVEPESRRHLEIVQRNAARLLGLVSDLLFAARLQSGHLELRPEPVDLRVLVAEAVHSARPHAEAAKVTLASAEEVPPVDGELARPSSCSTTSSRTRSSSRRPAAASRWRSRRKTATSASRSPTPASGSPTTSATRSSSVSSATNSVLERQIPGTGLGLYITKAIVEAHGGRIDVRAAAGEGTTFVVQLPVTKTLAPPRSSLR